MNIDGQGRIYVLWETFADRAQRPRGLAISMSEDGGRSFTAPTMVPDSADASGGSNGSHQGLLMKKLAVNRAGSVAVVNSSFKQDEYSRIWLMRARRR